MNDEYIRRVTGKQVLNDAVTLVKDAGTFVYDLSRLIVFKIKKLVENEKNKKKAAPQPE